jgi:hypothetical protein
MARHEARWMVRATCRPRACVPLHRRPRSSDAATVRDAPAASTRFVAPDTLEATMLAMATGAKTRSVGRTEANEHSSRSHGIVSVYAWLAHAPLGCVAARGTRPHHGWSGGPPRALERPPARCSVATARRSVATIIIFQVCDGRVGADRPAGLSHTARVTDVPAVPFWLELAGPEPYALPRHNVPHLFAATRHTELNMLCGVATAALWAARSRQSCTW